MFGPLKVAMGGKSSVLMKRYSRQCTSGCADNHKNLFLDESINFINAGEYALNEMETT
jgi:hypothetical protein